MWMLVLQSEAMSKENAFGLPGCELPNGTLCDACCIVKSIAALSKPKETRCDYQLPEGGCDLHGSDEKPPECRDFHCSDDSQHMNWEYIQKMEASGRITSDEANDARDLWTSIMP
jgi:hypothetical protein